MNEILKFNCPKCGLEHEANKDVPGDQWRCSCGRLFTWRDHIKPEQVESKLSDYGFKAPIERYLIIDPGRDDTDCIAVKRDIDGTEERRINLKGNFSETIDHIVELIKKGDFTRVSVNIRTIGTVFYDRLESFFGVLIIPKIYDNIAASHIDNILISRNINNILPNKRTYLEKKLGE